MAKWQRRPKGTGSIVEVKGLRKPYKAMKFLGRVDGKRKYKLVGYFASKTEAENALRDSKNWKDNKTIKFKEVYDMWIADEFKNRPKAAGHHQIAVKKIKVIWDTPISKLRLADLNALSDLPSMQTAKDSKKRVGEVLKNTFEWAVNHEIISVDYASRLTWEGVSAKDEAEAHQKRKAQVEALSPSFLAKNLLMQPDSIPRDYLLILMYSGCRAGELVKPVGHESEEDAPIPISNIDLKLGKMVGGSKTEAGRHREIPIHRNILPIVKKWYDDAVKEGRDTLFPYTLDYMRRLIRKQLPELGEYKITPSSFRNLFISQWNRQKLDAYIRKSIVGHELGKAIDEQYYIQITFEEKMNELQKLDYKYEISPKDVLESKKSRRTV